VNEQFVIAFSTFPDKEIAEKIARDLVQNAIVACANLVPSVESIYFWNEKVETSAEVFAIFKMPRARLITFVGSRRAVHELRNDLFVIPSRTDGEEPREGSGNLQVSLCDPRV
jgi:periplasmic divalent cation tolerance protein